VVSSTAVIPTPAVAYLAGTFDYDLGIVLSASHNPYTDNGIKVFSGRGEKFAEAEERRVEAIMAQDDWEVASSAEARLRPESLIAPYLDHVRRLFPSVGRLAGTRLAVDMANGATTTTAVTLLESLGFELVRRGDHPDGRNINLECGSTHPASLAAAVLEHGCQLGVAFDGDGDRAIFVDGRGHIVDGDAVLLVLAISALGAGRLIGNTVVATVMSNVGLEMALRKHGIRLIRTPVGDKHVIEEMLRGGYVLGGEQSGHVIQAEHLPTGDGLATALGVLRVMEATGRSLAELAADLVTYPQTLLNVRVREKAPIETVPAVSAAIGRVEHALANRGRLLVRYSGTEPLLRIMIEGEDQASIQMWAEEIAEAARSHLN
jgi:phosphoglucosamine mutase